MNDIKLEIFENMLSRKIYMYNIHVLVIKLTPYKFYDMKAYHFATANRDLT